MHLNLGSILRTNAFETPDAPVLRAGDLTITYGELDRAARGVATRLRERGIAPGDKVALLIPNVPEFTIAYFGILYAGATVVPINVLAAAPEVTYFLQDSEARMLDRAPALRRGRPRRCCAPGRHGRARDQRSRPGHARRVRRRRSDRPAPSDLAPGHRRHPLHLGHDRQAQGRRAHPLEPVPQLRRRRPAPAPADRLGPPRPRDAAALPLLRADRDPERPDRPGRQSARCCRASTPSRPSR